MWTKWIDLINPEYNINYTAGSSKGYRHSPESIEKMSKLATGRKHTDEVNNLMSKTLGLRPWGINNSFYNKKHTLETLHK